MLGGRNYNNKWHYYLSFVDVVAAFSICESLGYWSALQRVPAKAFKMLGEGGRFAMGTGFFLSLLFYGL